MWAAFVFGWPAAILSVLFGTLGVMGQHWKWTLAGALIGSCHDASETLARKGRACFPARCAARVDPVVSLRAS